MIMNKFEKLYNMIMQEYETTGPESYYDYHDVDTYAPYTDQDNDNDKLYEEESQDEDYQADMERYTYEVYFLDLIKRKMDQFGWNSEDQEQVSLVCNTFMNFDANTLEVMGKEQFNKAIRDYQEHSN